MKYACKYICTSYWPVKYTLNICLSCKNFNDKTHKCMLNVMCTKGWKSWRKRVRERKPWRAFATLSSLCNASHLTNLFDESLKNLIKNGCCSHNCFLLLTFPLFQMIFSTIWCWYRIAFLLIRLSLIELFYDTDKKSSERGGKKQTNYCMRTI